MIVSDLYKWRVQLSNSVKAARIERYTNEVILFGSRIHHRAILSLMCAAVFYHHYSSIRRHFWQANYNIILFALFWLAGKRNTTTKSAIKTMKSKQVNTSHVKYFVQPKVDTIFNRTNQLIRQLWKILLSKSVAAWKDFLRAKHLFFIYKKNLALQGFHIIHNLTVIIQLLQ